MAASEEPTQVPSDPLRSTIDAARGRAPEREPQLTRIGRFVLLDRLGEGGMGTVYAAFDERLDRRIALKVLSRSVDDVSRARMVREAQAMARIDDPNVVAVFDAGDLDGEAFIAMELVDGQTLREWQLAEPRNWRETLDVYIRAGRGLAAAHAVGLVHRDFKPHNVMIDAVSETRPTLAEQRVRVLDFGLAFERDGSSSVEETTPFDTRSASTVTPALTESGAVLGTPAYMAPEQIQGRPATLGTDQFAFCVALWEALYGARPFAGETIGELFAAVTEGRITEPDSTSSVPAWVLAGLRRGLQVDRRDRWPDMRTLLAELGRDRDVTRRRLVLAAGAVAVIGAASGATWLFARGPEPCDSVADDIAEVWSKQRRTSVRDALTDVDAPFAEATATAVDGVLQDYARDWMAARRDTCEAALVRREQSSEVMLARMRCLDGRKRSFEAVVRVLEAPDLRRLNSAATMANGMPRVDRCSDLDYVAADVPPPDDAALAQEVDEARRDLARAKALRDASSYADAHGVAKATLDRVRELGYTPVEVEARSELAWVLLDEGDFDDAKNQAEAAYVLSDAASVRTRVDNHRLLSSVYRAKGVYGDALVEARKAVTLGREKLGDSDLDVADAHDQLAVMLHETGDPVAAHAESRLALEIRRLLLPEGHLDVARSRAQVGRNLAELGRYAEALAELRRALAVVETTLGSEHPDVGHIRSSIAFTLGGDANYDEALEEHRRAFAIVAATFGPDDPRTARAHNDYGRGLADAGYLDDALREYRRALEIREHTVGGDHPDAATNRANIGSVYSRQDKLDAAAREIEKALEIRTAALGPDHVEVAILYNNLATVRFRQARYDESVELLRRGAQIRQRVLPADHPSVSLAHHNLGTVLFVSGKSGAAIAPLREALRAREQGTRADHPDIARIRSALGNALVAEGQPREGFALLRESLVAFEKEYGPGDSKTLVVVAQTAVAAFNAGDYERARSALRRLNRALEQTDDATMRKMAEFIAILVGERPALTGDVEALRDAFKAERIHDFHRWAEDWLARDGLEPERSVP